MSASPRSPSSTAAAHRVVLPIDQKWEFKQANSPVSEFRPVAQFPTNIHLDLMYHGIIEDPFIGMNEDKVQWVGKESWVYRTTFTAPALDSVEKAVLAFDGLDTYATVKLNGRTILSTNNMFVPERVNVTGLLDTCENTLEIVFQSAWEMGMKLRKQHPEHGWDWGPTLMTCGPWRPINLEIFTSRIADLHFQTDIDKSLKHAKVTVFVEVEGDADEVIIQMLLRDSLKAKATATIDAGVATATFHVPDPQLWYPAKYGEQPLYTLHATLLGNDTKLDTCTKRLGLRRARLVQRPIIGVSGKTFFFEINNIPVFCGGCNWIPADSFTPRISPQKYRDWLQLVLDGNQAMVRVWGGGIFEEQIFYDICDELGLLVWQDFLFACGNYPAYEDFLKSVEREAIANVKRLRHHPSILIWAGNNEDYQYAESEKLEYDPNDHDPAHWLKSTFPARYIYEKLLVDVMHKYSPGTYYHFGSPWGGKNTRDPLNGDIHQWNVWHGTQEKYQNFDKLSGRFVSEFGMQGFPSMKTIDSYLPNGKDDVDRYPQSSIVDFHNKAAGHERRLALYLVENIRYQFEPFEQYVYCTQVMQAECLASAYRLWRRQWKGPGKEYCAGALVWQINDCWPVTSWAIVDYYLQPKLAYYAIKRELAPVTIGLKRTMQNTPMEAHHAQAVIQKIEIWASNLSLETKAVEVAVKIFDVVTGEEVHSERLFDCFILEQNRSTEITEYEFPLLTSSERTAFRLVFAAYLLEDGKQIARYVNWPEPLKYVHLQRPEALQVTLSDDATKVGLSTSVPVKSLALGCELEGVVFDDNCVDLVPDEIVYIGVRGLSKGQEGLISFRYMF
ncbi:glycosyl hydrolase family 2 protein [Emydomyces testavorans]|uniref:Beta-mannosidase B n=1 Tax=Emydomyces testavorans TaxID=2070801 RepID=A0AAF0DJH4_9EURO|nr:glycosyl hydrolase family 2 protein [Emydomyces testavorans]